MVLIFGQICVPEFLVTNSTKFDTEVCLGFLAVGALSLSIWVIELLL